MGLPQDESGSQVPEALVNHVRILAVCVKYMSKHRV